MLRPQQAVTIGTVQALSQQGRKASRRKPVVLYFPIGTPLGLGFCGGCCGAMDRRLIKGGCRISQDGWDTDSALRSIQNLMGRHGGVEKDEG